MASTSGICAVLTRNIQKDLLDHLTPTAGTVATAITITGPIKMHLYTTAWTNVTPGTECADTHYAAQSISAWNADSVTEGAGPAAGYTSKTNTTELTYGGATGFNAAATITGVALLSSDATPVEVSYENFAAPMSVPINNNYSFANGAVSIAIG